MDLRLLSKDAELEKLCQEILDEHPGERCTITSKADPNRTEYDLYICDCHAHVELPAAVKTGSTRHLFLANRKDLPELYRVLGTTEANVLLKPVTRATLGAFIGLALSAHQERQSAARHLKADRDELLQCLIQANLKLQEYDQDRTNFLARAVHDFRAPLTAISGYCGLLLSESIGQMDEDQREVLSRMQNSAKRLSRMAAAMFQLSVGRQTKATPELVKGDLHECVQQSVHEIAPFADKKQITISFDLDEEPGQIFIEPGQIEQVLTNLLDNSCKFTPKGGAIEIRGYPFFWDRRRNGSVRPLGYDRRRHAVREPNAYRIDIVDSGAPIPVEHLEDIFEEYTSYSGVRDRSGGGLGLAICRMIINQHDGKVWAENSSTGPMFSFVLPINMNEPASSDIDAECSQLPEARNAVPQERAYDPRSRR